MPALDSVGTTEHMTPAQLEFFGKLFLAENRTYQLAPWFMGIWLDTLLLGLMLVLYAQWQAGSAKTDQKWSKVTVYYLVIMHICLSGLLLAWLFYMFGSGFGQYGMMLNVKWTQATYAVSALCRFPCSLFYTYRAWVMYRRHWAIPVAICPLIAAAVACGLAVAATYRYMPLGKTPKTFIWVMMLLEIIVDVTLSLLLVVGLSRSKTGFKQTDRLIKRVLQLTVETQLPPTLSSALFLVITIKLGMTTQAAWFIAKPKLYPICLFIVLISRKHLARQHRIGEAYVHDSFALASTAGSMMTSDSIKQIRVDTVTHTAVTQQDMAFDKRQQKRINRIPVAPISPSARSDPSDISIKE